MFLIVRLTKGEGSLEMEKLENFTHVSLVDITPRPSKKLLLLGDFVEPSIVERQAVGLIGVSGAPFPLYVPINIRRSTLRLSLVAPRNLTVESTINSLVTLHLKADK